ncbi:Protein goliath [Tolypocladium ophioglossoides CBS 100239]|uniref:RING-type E3 ubiquitin transferase n=1 Tax=Tolypocladium ophioglossoides (strain CBS 100239) TaxID=1163406 RepID=A0A0L0NJT7_TOLOC|nr:Protein goliath [Tolypocladium ophioglossoides CBS 100239]
MAMPTISCSGRLTSLLFTLLCAVAVVAADGGATTSAQQDVPQWASNNALQLTLSTQPGLQFTTIPITENLGLNESDRTRGIVKIYGNLKPANMSNYNQITDRDDVAYLSCDRPSGDSFINPDKMLNDLMKQRPKAIVLYSTNGNWCSISDDETLPYTSILTMADAGEATNVLSQLNGTKAGLDVKALISGNATDDGNNGSGSGGGGSNNSAVAMSILYSITGLITLLFLIIIATGAIRAHRYPERYGPRGAFGGRSRQSRAKGIARAVLDTIPIVKFGNQEPTKPDPEQELDTATTDGHDVPTQMTAPNLTEDGRPDTAATSRRASHDTTASASNSHAATDSGQVSNSNLECSICTEDFKVGEDVRVLPCNHRFHPNCVDPWLVDVAGTCPLCRLDLRPGQGSTNSGLTARDNESIAPPLTLEGEDGHAHSGSHGHRHSRPLDINRLRQASVEERMEALRQMRAQANEHDSREGDGVERPHGARLTDKLKDKFRIRTRAQPAERREG